MFAIEIVSVEFWPDGTFHRISAENEFSVKIIVCVENENEI